MNEGVEWVILTSGVVWHVYHLTGGLPIVVDLALDVDLFGEETLAQKAKPTLLPNQRVPEETPNRHIVAGQAGYVAKVLSESSVRM